MINKIIMVLILVIIIGVIGWIGLSIYSCSCGQNIGQSNMPNMPDQEEATYSVYIENTGGLLLTNDYEALGAEVGNRVFILHSFWELRGQKFKFMESDIVLDEAIFGEITLKRR